MVYFQKNTGSKTSDGSTRRKLKTEKEKNKQGWKVPFTQRTEESTVNWYVNEE